MANKLNRYIALGKCGIQHPSGMWYRANVADHYIALCKAKESALEEDKKVLERRITQLNAKICIRNAEINYFKENITSLETTVVRFKLATMCFITVIVISLAKILGS